MRELVFWTAMAFYGATAVTCIGAVLGAWIKHIPARGPSSVAYFNPLTNIFLGLGFIVVSLITVSRPLRLGYVIVGLFQFWPAWIIWKRRRQLRH